MISLIRAFQVFVIIISVLLLVPTLGFIIVPMCDTLSETEEDIKRLRYRARQY